MAVGGESTGFINHWRCKVEAVVPRAIREGQLAMTAGRPVVELGGTGDRGVVADKRDEVGRQAAHSIRVVAVGACGAGIAVGRLEVAEGARMALDGELGAIVGIRGVAGEGGLDEQDGSTVAVDSSPTIGGESTSVELDIGIAGIDCAALKQNWVHVCDAPPIGGQFTKCL